MLRIHEAKPSHLFFKNELSPRLAQERKLFIAYQKALAMQPFFDHNNYLDSYFQIAWAEIIRSQFLDEKIDAFLNRIKDHEREILARLEKVPDSRIINFLGTVKKAGIDANRLYETLLKNPGSLSEKKLEEHLLLLCKLDAHDTLESILKKQPKLADKLPYLFHTAIHSFNLETMKKCVEMGLDFNEKISLNEFTKELRDYEDRQVTWLMQIILSLEYFFMRSLSIFMEKSNSDANFTCIGKVKSILAYLLELGLDPDQEIDEANKATCRSICNVQIEEMKKLPDGLSENDEQCLSVRKIQAIYIDVLSVIANAPLKMTCKPKNHSFG